MADPIIAFIGAGNMSSTIIGGLVAKGYPAANIIATATRQASLDKLTAIAPVTTTLDNQAAIAQADVVVLGVKPQVMKSVCLTLAPAIQAKKPLVISLAAGLTLNSFSEWLGEGLALVRCMPNTPSLVQCGASGLYGNAAVSPAQRDMADSMMKAVGISLWVEQESDIDAVTAVSGSGPAYYFLVMEAMQAAGVQLGLSPEVARQLTLQTALGAATMASQSSDEAAELRRKVTSPGGTTEQAILSLQADGLEAMFAKAMTACRDRAIVMAKEMAG
ncbi:pyrroline-5-carboxylate reductase [Dasania sp. GY-MA-18]|uniref:Pyrroline-5-carboxylate reductase n=1 Tax=Dasania phycosphaerae TaxID=2950436 RepID=A0A9J6RKG5_9GAMM|nr:MULTISPECIES: pyrroline-5-carboxylate reductase [Dasania]MCR8922462.1 pyrroline-5-carboxylate reductase [Dasania sp. GY-MA-18]MCZ0864890.1 pyrroline-5-carboxylate reductase [Dasania phycosphaerae]MCZ0868618.1 pyrroline-5-carboxylate reductase [Dasania phycosphaerae]